MAITSKNRPWKLCIVCRNKKKLLQVLNAWKKYPAKYGNKPKVGWVGFLYCDYLSVAMAIRDAYYVEPDLYIFLQHETPIIKYYGIPRRVSFDQVIDVVNSLKVDRQEGSKEREEDSYVREGS